MVVTLGQQYNNVGEKPTVILYTYIDRHAEPSNINNTTSRILVSSKHTNVGAWVNSKLSGRDLSLLYNYIQMHGHNTKTNKKDTISLNCSTLCYIRP